MSRKCARYSIGFAGRSLTSCAMPVSRIGTTVWSRYARMGSCCSSTTARADEAAGSAEPGAETAASRSISRVLSPILKIKKKVGRASLAMAGE